MTLPRWPAPARLSTAQGQCLRGACVQARAPNRMAQIVIFCLFIVIGNVLVCSLRPMILQSCYCVEYASRCIATHPASYRSPPTCVRRCLLSVCGISVKLFAVYFRQAIAMAHDYKVFRPAVWQWGGVHVARRDRDRHRCYQRDEDGIGFREDLLLAVAAGSSHDHSSYF